MIKQLKKCLALKIKRYVARKIKGVMYTDIRELNNRIDKLYGELLNAKLAIKRNESTIDNLISDLSRDNGK